MLKIIKTAINKYDTKYIIHLQVRKIPSICMEVYLIYEVEYKTGYQDTHNVFSGLFCRMDAIRRHNGYLRRSAMHVLCTIKDCYHPSFVSQ